MRGRTRIGWKIAKAKIAMTGNISPMIQRQEGNCTGDLIVSALRSALLPALLNVVIVFFFVLGV